MAFSPLEVRITWEMSYKIKKEADVLKGTRDMRYGKLFGLWKSQTR
jgi:hypothetical protein